MRQARERFQAQLILISHAQQLILLNNPLDFVLVHVLSLRSLSCLIAVVRVFTF